MLTRLFVGVLHLWQVELEHARLAMLAVLLSGAVGAGAGVADAQVGFSVVSYTTV